jgi:hypothetical protein
MDLRPAYGITMLVFVKAPMRTDEWRQITAMPPVGLSYDPTLLSLPSPTAR